MAYLFNKHSMNNLKCNVAAVYILNGQEMCRDHNEELPVIGDYIVFKDGRKGKVIARVWQRDLDGGFQRNLQIQCMSVMPPPLPCKLDVSTKPKLSPFKKKKK